MSVNSDNDKKTKQTKPQRKENPTSFNLVCRKNFGRAPKA